MWRVHASVKLEKQRQWLWWLQLVRLGIGSSVPWTVSSKHCRLPLQTLYVRLDSDPAYNPEVHVQQSVCEWYDKNSLIKFGAACMHVKQRKPWNIFTKYDSLAWQAPPPPLAPPLPPLPLSKLIWFCMKSCYACTLQSGKVGVVMISNIMTVWIKWKLQKLGPTKMCLCTWQC